MDNPFDQFDAAPASPMRQIIPPAPPKPPAPNLPTGYQMGPDGIASYIPGLPAPKEPAGETYKPTEFQSKSAGFLGRLTRANKAWEALPEAGRAPRGIVREAVHGAFPGLENTLLNSPDRQIADQNALDFVRATLRQESGAAINADEEVKQYKIFFPVPGDTPQVLAEKKLARQQAIEGFKVAAGPLSDQVMANIVTEPAAQPEAPADIPQPPVAPSQSGSRSIIDPRRQQIAGEIGALITKGADRNVIMGRAAGMDPSLRADPRFRAAVDQALRFRSSSDWVKWQRLNKGQAYPVDPSFYTTEQPLSDQGVLGTGLGSEQDLNRAAQSGVGAGFVGGIDTAMGGTLDEAVGLLGGDAEGAERAKQAIAAGQPGPNFAGQMVGGTLGALGGEAALARFGMAPGAGRALAADIGFGGSLGAGSAEDGNRLRGAAIGAASGFGGNLVGRGATNTLGRVTAGVSDPSVQALIKQKIPLTIGQAVGKSGVVGRTMKGLEDRLAGISGGGDVISARLGEGVEAMNSKAFDRALEPLNKSVGNLVGEEAVAQAQDHVGDAFTDALGGKVATLDRPFITQAASAKRAIQALPRLGTEVESSVDDLVNEYFDASGNLSGENMQALLRGLEDIKRSYKNDPLGHRVGKSIEMVSQSIEGMFRRQAPDVMPKYDLAKQAFKRLSTLEDAVLRGKNTGGKFSAAQLGLADRANTVRYGGKHRAASGGGEFHDFQRNAQEVLPNKVPDSGTAGRLLLPAAIVGAGSAGGGVAGDTGSGAKVGLGLSGLLMLAYSKAGQRALVAGVAKRGPKTRAAGKFIKDRARLIGSVGATGAVLGTSPDQ